LQPATADVEEKKQQAAVMSKSSATIDRPYLDRVAQLGDLYDARTDNFTGKSMLRHDKLPPDAVSTSPNYSQHAKVLIMDSSSRRSEKFDVSAELQLSVLVNLVKVNVNSSAGYVAESRSSRKALQAVLAYDVTTDVESVNVMSNGIRKYLNLDILKHGSATHFVSAVYWGAKARLTITDENVNESDKKTIQTKLETKLNQVATTLTAGQQVTDLDVVDSSFKMEMYSDVSTETMPTVFEQGVALMNQFPSLVKGMNNGRGKPIKFELFPLADVDFRTHVGLPLPAKFAAVQPLDEPIVAAFVGHFDDVSLFRRELTDYCEYGKRLGLSEPLRGAIVAFERKSAAMENKLRKKVKELMIRVKSGKANKKELEKLLDQAREELASYDAELEKIVRKREHVYSVEVYTGNKYGAGTDANVFVKLFGKYSESADIPLVTPQQQQGPARDCFECNQKDVFEVKAPLLLGLRKLRIWHDNTGSNAGWFLNKVVVRDKACSREEYEFPCNKWLTDESACDLLPSNVVN
jgi:enamine deaminase RidA (YjgF/YER057c/UK114 family)